MNIWEVFEYTAAVTVVGLLIWLIKWIFHDKLDARWHYFIWLVLLVRLVVPVSFGLIRTPLSIFHELPIGKWLEMGEVLALKKGYGGLFDLLGRVYLWGAALLGAYYLITWLILRVRVGLAPKADKETRQYVEDIAAKYGLKSCRRIRVGRSSTPYICGVICPILVLPEGNLRPEEPIIVHELMHGKFKDVLVNLGLHAVRVINWFNPVVWILTLLVQNDSEALCDQRVLERCGEDKTQAYGEMLIAMTEGKRRSPVKIGTSNMAGSFRNMKTRIRRIRDFRRVPGHIGPVTLCITLMLAVAGIGSYAQEPDSFEIPRLESGEDLERALLYAQCYHAGTPQQAVYLFLRAVGERNLLYRMAVLPEEQIGDYEAFVKMCFDRNELTVDGELQYTDWGDDFLYFPRGTDSVRGFRVYNLQCDETRGTAIVCAELEEQDGQSTYAEWRLMLTQENGWKVRLTEESDRIVGAYEPDPMLYGSVRLGDFLAEISGYNEGYFNQLNPGYSSGFIYGSDTEVEEEAFPEFFSMETKCKSAYLTYLGEESLEGREMRVEVTSLEEPDSEQAESDTVTEWAGGTGSTGETGRKTVAGSGSDTGRSAAEWAGDEEGIGNSYNSYSYSDSTGNSHLTFDGEQLMTGEPKLIGGGGSGYSEPGWSWQPDDKIGAYIRIYIDGELVEEGELWSESH